MEYFIPTIKDPGYDIMVEGLVSFGVLKSSPVKLGYTELGEKYMTLTDNMKSLLLVIEHKETFTTNNKQLFALAKKFIRKNPQYKKMINIYAIQEDIMYRMEAARSGQTEGIKKLFKYIVSQATENPMLLTSEPEEK